MNNVQNNAEQIPAGMSPAVWHDLPTEIRKYLWDLEVRIDARRAMTPEKKAAAADKAVEDLKDMAAYNVDTALESLVSDLGGSFEGNEAAMAVEGLLRYAETNGIDDVDIVGPLKACVVAAYVLAYTEGPASDAVEKLVKVTGIGA